MISPSEIRKKALRLYKRFCLAYLNKEPFFPLTIPSNKGKTTDPYLKRKKELELIMSESKEKKGFGYSLEWEKINTKQFGAQSIITKIFFQTAEDYLRFIKKSKEFKNMCRTATLIRSEMPVLEKWMKQNPHALEISVDIWPDILLVCKWFIHHPAPKLYIRQIPVPIHTKFIEENSSLLTSLLDFLLPAEHIDTVQRDFARRFRLYWDEPLIRCRFRCKNQEDDISRPLSIFQNNVLPGSSVFIIENIMNFLTFPVNEQRLVIWGKGVSAPLLKNTHWLSDRFLYYWGDIDPPGFEILSSIRKYYPEIKSFLMDTKSYEKYRHYAVFCDTGRTHPPLYLTIEEKELYHYLKDHPSNGRLEQERIPQEEVNRMLFNISKTHS